MVRRRVGRCHTIGPSLRAWRRPIIIGGRRAVALLHHHILPTRSEAFPTSGRYALYDQAARRGIDDGLRSRPRLIALFMKTITSSGVVVFDAWRQGAMPKRRRVVIEAQSVTMAVGGWRDRDRPTAMCRFWRIKYRCPGIVEAGRRLRQVATVTLNRNDGMKVVRLVMPLQVMRDILLYKPKALIVSHDDHAVERYAQAK